MTMKNSREITLEEYGLILKTGERKGDEKIMNETENKLQMHTVKERMPELSQIDSEGAVTHTNLSWAHEFMNNHLDGQIHFMKSIGVSLQKVSENKVRCVAIVDHSYCFTGLSMLKLTFDTANIDLEIDPFTVITPYVPKENRDEEPGCEVA